MRLGTNRTEIPILGRNWLNPTFKIHRYYYLDDMANFVSKGGWKVARYVNPYRPVKD